MSAKLPPPKRPRTRAGTSAERPKRVERMESQVEMTDPIPKFELNELAKIDWGDVENATPPRSGSLGRAESIPGDIVGDDAVVEEFSAGAPMTFAAFEGPRDLAMAEQAIVAAGHACATAATGRAGMDEVKRAIARGTIDVLLVGLPGGEALIDAAHALEHRPIIIASCAGSSRDAIPRAIASSADLVAMRPHDVERLAPIIFAASRLQEERRAAPAEARGVAHHEAGALQPFDLFQRVLETELRRARRFAYPLSVGLFVVQVTDPPPGVKGILRARAGNALIQAIRDIDLATELDQERFLVLMPHTDATTADAVARRVITVAGACDPVLTSGRSFPVRMIGAVAGARLDEPLSFARLMKDATRALNERA